MSHSLKYCYVTKRLLISKRRSQALLVRSFDTSQSGGCITFGSVSKHLHAFCTYPENALNIGTS
jgi:hypothetical protein